MKTNRHICLAGAVLFLLSLFNPSCINAAIYRSKISGDWSAPATWQINSGGAWVNATMAPGIADIVTVRAGHAVGINFGDVAALGVTVDAGGSLLLLATFAKLFIDNGQPGADFVVNGLFQDNGSSSNGVQFSGGATWQLGAGATFVKTNNSSAATYRDSYHGGMQSISPTASWVIRRIAGDVSFTTIGTYYPNLTIESNAGNWFPSIGSSRFQGSSGTAVILGNLDVGGNGGGSVTLVNENTAFAPISVYGQCIIRAGSTLTNAGNQMGTGFDCKGGLVVDGFLNITGNSSVLRFSGGGQSVAGNGFVNLEQVEVNVSGSVFMQRTLSINGDLSLFNGKVVLLQSDLSVGGNIVGSSSNKYVQTTGSGSLRLFASGSQLFPVGNNSYNPAILQQSGGGWVGVRVEDWVLDQGTSGTPLTSQMVSRSWHVSGASAGMSLTLQWNAAEEWPGFDRNTCYISQFAGAWQADTPGAAIGGNPYLRSRSGLSGNGVYAVASSGALPIELAWWRGSAQEEDILLEWETFTEHNNAGFTIEHSLDGRFFTSIGGLPGAGESLTPQYYSFVHRHPEAGVHYYRLRQDDFDGPYTYSQVIAITMEGSSSPTRLYPTLTTGVLRIDGLPATSLSINYSIVDANSSVWQRGRIPNGSTSFIFRVDALAPGSYWVILENPGERETLRFFRVE